MRKKKISCIITDLDNTIWDWFTMWHESFKPYLDRIHKEFEIPIKDLEHQFRELHRHYHTSESSFVYQEIPAIIDANISRMEEVPHGGGKSIMHEYYSNKKNSLKLYPGVLEVLKALRDKGVMVIGFTESQAFFTKYRLKHLGMDGLFHAIYSPITFDLPESVTTFYDEGYWEPIHTEFRYLPPRTVKPDPGILQVILNDHGIELDEVIYIGDKLEKDVHMANEANVESVYAKYGDFKEGEAYDLLRRVSHWSDEDIQREREFRDEFDRSQLQVDVVLENSFKDIYNHYHFIEFQPRFHKPDKESVLSIWSKVIDVQQHFNDIELRIRNIATGVYTFFIGAIGFVSAEKLKIEFFGIEWPAGLLIACAGLVAIFAFFYMDKYWYHRLLLGAVKKGADIEKRWGNVIPEIELAKSISESSPHMIYGLTRRPPFIIRKEIHSDQKFAIFYGALAFVLIVYILFTFLFVLIDHYFSLSIDDIAYVLGVVMKKSFLICLTS